MNNNKSKTTENFVWLPTVAQELLLRSALLNDDSAITHWQKWKNLVNPPEVGLAEKRLFPLVYHNLQTFQYKDEYTELLKTTHRDSFRKNVNLLRIAGAITSQLKSCGIRTILLKGAALALQYYASTALRPMSDIDLMIQPENIQTTIEILKRSDWQTQENNLSLTIEIIHSCQFLDAENREMDLHWRLMRDCWNADKNTVFWNSAVPLKHQTIESEALCATDQLFHVCCHGARYNDVPPIRWVADAIMILNSPNEIDWQRILLLGKTYRLSLPLYHTLRYLEEKFNATIPVEFFESLEKTPKSRLERMSFKHFSEPPRKWSAWRFLKEAAVQYSSLKSSTDLNPRSLVFIKYLQHFMTSEKILKKLSTPR